MTSSSGEKSEEGKVVRWIMDLLRRWRQWSRRRAEEKARFEKAMDGLLEMERAWEKKVAAARGDND